MMRKSKKAWLRIVEAFIAILIVASVLIVMTTRAPQKDKTEEVHKIQRFVLEQVSSNETLRGEILENNAGSADNVEKFIKEQSFLPPYYNFSINICEVDEICGMPYYVETEVYADEMLIASNLTKYSPKKIKFFVWVE